MSVASLNPQTDTARVANRALSRAGHQRWVRTSHWIMAASVVTLAFTGFVIRMAHRCACAWTLKLGYKRVKFLQRIVVTDTFDDLRKLGDLQNGWSWYVGI